jgi:hypothetical protein
VRWEERDSINGGRFGALGMVVFSAKRGASGGAPAWEGNLPRPDLFLFLRQDVA